jgi:predicted DCC family thiol-disulfide oxidoreductase YuxK
VPRDTCYYDGLCGMCRRTTRLLRAVDLFHRLEFVDLTAVPPESLPVAPEAAMAGMPMRTRAGRTLLGFPAVRRALSQTALAPAGWLLYLPGVSHLGRIVYKRIAASRRRDCPPGLPLPGPARILRS